MPDTWAAVHSRLLEAWKRAEDATIPKPPHPLILDGWSFSCDMQKRERWLETVRWASTHGLSHLIPQIEERDTYRVPT